MATENLQVRKALTERRYSQTWRRVRSAMACTGWKCLPGIATGAKRPRNDKSGDFTVLTAACTDRSCGAGPGCPLPCNAWPEVCIFFILHFSVFISMRPSPATHYRFLASGVDFSCASCRARMMRFETSQPRGVRYQREPLCAARPCAAKRSSSCCSGAKGSR